MTRKSEGIFATVGRAADESVAIADAIRAGRLTRAQFDAWYNRRRSEGAGIVVRLRERAEEMGGPAATLARQGERFAATVMPAPRRRRRRAVRRRSAARSSRRTR